MKILQVFVTCKGKSLNNQQLQLAWQTKYTIQEPPPPPEPLSHLHHPHWVCYKSQSQAQLGRIHNFHYQVISGSTVSTKVSARLSVVSATSATCRRPVLFRTLKLIKRFSSHTHWVCRYGQQTYSEEGDDEEYKTHVEFGLNCGSVFDILTGFDIRIFPSIIEI